MSVNEKMTAIADAIREKTGDTGKLSLDGMAEALRKLPGPIVATAVGNPIALSDATDLKLRGLKLFGKTTQNGTPTPDAPVPLVSAGDGGDIRTLILPAVKSLEDDTLCGIPVTSGGNYTDETGQQWVCDEVDFGRGIYVQRIFGTVFKNAAEWRIAGTKNGLKRFFTNQFMGVIKKAKDDETKECATCSHFINVTATDTWNEVTGISVNSKGRLDIYYSGIEQTTAALDVYFSSNPVTFMAELATPIETPLPAEELAAYAEKYGVTGTVYGRTTQNGTPSPDAPVPLVSYADVCQSILASTPNGLPGIPVTSGGNYTDETGQQWVCDEVDFVRGVYVSRVATEILNRAYTFKESADIQGRFVAGNILSTQFRTASTPCLCTIGKWVKWGAGTSGTDWVAISETSLYFYPSTAMTADEVNSIFRGFYESKAYPVVLGVLETPIETPLSAEELAAYAALHTNYPNTTILNDGGAGMEVKYVADTKNYIDNQIAAVAAAIVNA